MCLTGICAIASLKWGLSFCVYLDTTKTKSGTRMTKENLYINGICGFNAWGKLGWKATFFLLVVWLDCYLLVCVLLIVVLFYVNKIFYSNLIFIAWLEGKSHHHQHQQRKNSKQRIEVTFTISGLLILEIPHSWHRVQA